MFASISRPVLFAATLFAVCSVPALHAQQCSNRSLSGSYGYTVTGTIVTASGPLAAGPFAAVGKITFDGAGHVSTVRTLSDNGHVLQADAGTGTYQVNADCTGSFNISVGPPGGTIQLTLNLVLDGTDELRAIVTNAGTVLVFEGRRQYLLPSF